MKKLLIALLALGTLSYVPVAEAGYRKEKSCKKEKPCKDNCTKSVKKVGTRYEKVMVPGKRPVHQFEETTTCTTTKVRPFEECGEPVCAIDGDNE